MFTKQLIIFEYEENGAETQTDWFWTDKKEQSEIKDECYDWIAEANDFEPSEVREDFTVTNFWIVEDAVLKSEVTN